MIEIGAVYLNGYGVEVWIAGPTKVDSEWVWSTQGNWYRQSDGRFISYRENPKAVNEWIHVPNPEPTPHDLSDKIKDSWL